MRKFKLFLSLENEEKWINMIQDKGYKLTKVNRYLYTYTFEKMMDKEEFSALIRLDFRSKSMNKKEYLDYQTLYNDSGWRLLNGSRYGGVQYFQQKSENTARSLFSDQESQQMIAKKYTEKAVNLGLLYLFYFFLFNKSTNLLNVKTWYLTPGIWEEKGSLFWKIFLFETPFVLLRVLPLFLLLFTAIYYLAKSFYNKQVR